MTGVFLGVDGGGTGTRFCLLDGQGVVLGRAEGRSAYYFTEGISLVGHVLSDGVTEVCHAAGIEPDAVTHAFFGLPGYGESSTDRPQLDAVGFEVLGHDRYLVGNDMVCGWAGSLGAADGINVISGTGSMTYGERRGVGVRVGGWGEVFGDEGSAYWIAAAGLRAFSRMSDGRQPVGPLHGLLREHLGLTEDLDLVDRVLNRWKSDRREIAGLAPVVGLAARRGDVAAKAVLMAAADALLEIVEVTRSRLGFEPGETVPVSWSGGVLRDDLVRSTLARALSHSGHGYELREPLLEPVVGAAVHAAALAGNPLGRQALDDLHVHAHDDGD